MTIKKSAHRGIRNNNPGNIRYVESIKWIGQIGQDDKGFAVFSDPQWGIAAILKNLGTYQRKHDCGTVQKIIERWAPPHENATTSYVDFVAASLGVDSDQRIDVSNEDVARNLVKSIIRRENGEQPYSEELLTKSMMLAGIDTSNKVKPLTQSRTVAGAALALTGLTVVPAIQSLVQNQDLITAFVTVINPSAAGFVPHLMALVGAAVTLYARVDDYRKAQKAP